MYLRIVAGKFKSLKINVPSTSLRPSSEKVREALFNTLFSMLDFEEKSFLDIFSGSGAVGIEALSRGFAKVTLVEKDLKNVKTIRENIFLLKSEISPEVTVYDVFNDKFTSLLSKNFDVIFLDPPYKDSFMLPDLIKKLIDEKVVSLNGVIAVETGEEFSYNPAGWQKKNKKYGNTFLTYYWQ